MPLLIPGAESSESLTQFDCEGSVSNAGLTVFAAAFRFIHRGSTVWGDSASVKIANSESNHNFAMGLTISGVSNNVHCMIRCRTAKKNAYSHGMPITQDTVHNLGIRADFVNQVVEYFVDGVAIDPPTPMEEADSWNSSFLKPFLRSQIGTNKDTEWHKVAFWTNAGDTDPENIDLNVPTSAQMVAITAGGDFSEAPAPKSWVEPAGADGTYAGNFPDLAMSGQVWSQTSGPTTGDLAPYFVGPPAEVDVSVETTARTLSIEGTTSASGGTVYVIVDTAANMPTPPNPEDVVGGFLADGVTAALDSASQAMTGTTNLSVAFEPLPANTNLAYAIVHDRDDEGDYTAVIYGTISTKRPVIVPATTEKRLLDAGEPVISETGMTMWVLGTEYSRAGYSTDGSGLFELDLTDYLNTTGTEDIGDTVDIVLTLADGERGIVAMGQTITEGD